jgi:hypothetical protein
MTVSSLILDRGSVVSVTRPTISQDASGSMVWTYSTTPTLTTLYVQRGQPTQTLVDGSRRTATAATAYALAGTDILPRDRVAFGGQSYEVTGVLTPDDLPSSDPMAFVVVTMDALGGEA